MFHISLNIDSLVTLDQRTKIKADILLERACADLAAQTHAHIVERASAKLHSTRSTYLEALSYEQVGDAAYTITLDKSAVWIEDGMPRHEMIDDLLRNTAQYSKKTGARYRSIPFIIKSKTQTPAAAQVIRQAAQAALRKGGINMREIEKDVDGRIKQGTLHHITDIHHPLRTTTGPYQGHGPHGHPRQGMGGTPFLSGLRVMQRTVGVAPPIVQKTAMTFRTVSSLHKGTGRWVHPGIKAAKIFDEAYEWATKEWDSKIKPDVLAALGQ